MQRIWDGLRSPGEGGKGDLGGVEELSALIPCDGADEDAVGGAWPMKSRMPSMPVSNGHGFAVGVARPPWPQKSRRSCPLCSGPCRP